MTFFISRPTQARRELPIDVEIAQSDAFRRERLELRAAVGPEARTRAAAKALAVARAQPRWRAARSMAAYLPVRGEFDARPLLAGGHEDGKRCFVPVLDGNEMVFRAWAPDAAMSRNRFGIPEPAGGEVIDAHDLDIVLAPLVAFDDRGMRMGMGGGYYDRAFAFLAGGRGRPFYLGLAFALQRVPRLIAHSWDVALDAVLTEDGWRTFEGR